MGRPKTAARAGQRWEAREDRILAFLYGRVSTHKIARRLKRSHCAVKIRLWTVGLRVPKNLHRPSLKEWRVAAQQASQATSIPVDRIMSMSRVRTVVRARWIAFKYMRDRQCSLGGIGAVTGHDHTTVMHGLLRLAQEQTGKTVDPEISGYSGLESRKTVSAKFSGYSGDGSLGHFPGQLAGDLVQGVSPALA